MTRMDDKKKEMDEVNAFSYLSGLADFAGNKTAVDAAKEKLGKAAKGYSDEELTRFARLIILFEHPPGEWRQDLLEEVSERDEALEEIAMSIDSSWISSQVENEIFVDEFRNEVIRSYPNPSREGCPDESSLRRVVFGRSNEFKDSQALTEHTLSCGPCMQQFCNFLKEKARSKV
jgi:hypothetical protein